MPEALRLAHEILGISTEWHPAQGLATPLGR